MLSDAPSSRKRAKIGNRQSTRDFAANISSKVSSNKHQAVLLVAILSLDNHMARFRAETQSVLMALMRPVTLRTISKTIKIHLL